MTKNVKLQAQYNKSLKAKFKMNTVVDQFITKLNLKNKLNC